MGVFGIFKSNKEENTPYEDEITSIARVISEGSDKVLSEVRECAADITAYFAKHRERYEQRGLDGSEDEGYLQWIALADILIEEGFACELDWKCEKADFLHFAGGLRGIKRAGIELSAEWLEEDGDVSSWCGVLREKLEGTALAALDIDSDSYVIFAVPSSEYGSLEQYAARIGQRIAMASDM